MPGGDGKGMSIIEIAPSTQGDLLDFGHESRGISFADPANILRVHDQNRRFFKTPPKMTRNEQERALATIMTEARKTPPRLRIIRPDCISWNQARREDSSESVCSDRTRGYLMTGSRAPIQKIQAESEVQNTPSATVQSCHDNPDLQKKHTAFQKMLQKLQRKNPQAPQVSQVHQVSQVSRKGFDAQSRQFKERSCISMPERQAHGNGSSDSGIGLYPNTNKREKQDSTDSGISIGSSAKQLNPRAREFLTRDQVTSLINEKLDKVNGRSVPAKASIGLVLPHKSIPAVPEKREAFEGKTASPSAFRGTASSNVSHSPFDRLFGFAPPSNLGFHANGPPLGPTVPSIIPQSGLGLNVESLATFGGAGGQGNLSNAKPAPPILNMSMTTALPFMNNFPVPLVMPTSSWGSVEGPRPLLCPVPKPRKPDTQDQQAYEAWIEWRKATEPGYAMECKNRQQRRTRRIQGAGFHSHVHAPAQTAS
ncbi:hypothetical protein B0T10DRAFT_554452 [Thelonectria olida]|uniref:Uncharacterized protein n=1 Tax=Thelonectria olida TaxID=1576542 RepID=A0A9P8WLD2_9HYPO|nr:hypothetical protein B0T10DRAFT_554452 [Thelonectria olida]